MNPDMRLIVFCDDIDEYMKSIEESILQRAYQDIIYVRSYLEELKSWAE